MADRHTIFALSSGRPPAAIAVIRISGPRAGDALERLTGKLPEPRKAAFARVRDPQTNEPIDEALALWFPAPSSETGEDVAELQLHGGRAVIAATLAALSGIDGLRPAEAGEFTRRAFENGKLDLTAVEGLADLVMAETQGQRRQALRQMQGALRERAESWRERLIRALALVEARIDFSDEADVPEDLAAPALALARSLASEIEAVLADGRRGERLREGLVVAIAGPPNAGKSTLLNRIARREAAIVSPYAGTTRDVIEVHLDLDGWPVTLLDTAGIRDSDDPVEREGVRRARERAAAADLVLWVVDAAGSDDTSSSFRGRPEAGTRNPETSSEQASGFRVHAFSASRNDEELPPTWLIRNKIDLMGGSQRNELGEQSVRKTEPLHQTNSTLTNMVNERLTPRNESGFAHTEPMFNLSAATGEGFDALFSALTRHAADFLAGAEPALVTRQRQRVALGDGLAALRRALTPDVAKREDLLAEELRIAARALGRLTGRVDVEDILDVIFRDFCIGK
jgi:tRNA modification GTPase